VHDLPAELRHDAAARFHASRRLNRSTKHG
jgi:hypothetical protein